MKKIFICFMLSLLITMSVFATKVSVMHHDGTVQIGTFESANQNIVTITTNGGKQEISIDQINLISFLDNNTILTYGSVFSVPENLVDKREYSYNGQKYTIGFKDRQRVLYGPSGALITDALLIEEFEKLEALILKMNPDVFKSHINIINNQIKTTKIQNAAKTIRDFSAGVAVNSVIAMVSPAEGVKLATLTVGDLVGDALNAMTNPETYMLALADMNLRHCRDEFESFIRELDELKSNDDKGQTRDIENCLDLVGRYQIVSTIYNPSYALIKALTAKGDGWEQLKEIGDSIGKKVVGTVTGTGDVFTSMQIADNIYSKFGPYKDYQSKLKELYAINKKDMPFFSDSSFMMNFGEEFAGINFKTDISWLENYENRKKFDEMIENLPKNPFQQNTAFNPQIETYKVVESENMVLVKGGTFKMGDTWTDDNEGWDNERPVHDVTLSYDFWMGKYEVTFDEYDNYCELIEKAKPDAKGWGREQRPVINVSWWDAIAYCNWLSDKEGLPRAYDSKGNLIDRNQKITSDITKVMGYRLPTEAEWEFAARGGNRNKYDLKYSGSDYLGEVGWYDDNSSSKTHEVGQKNANALGIYDMSGNVWEWCHDWYDSGFYKNVLMKNPVNTTGSSDRIKRGGSWGNSAVYCRVAYRGSYDPSSRDHYIGFRIVRTK